MLSATPVSEQGQLGLDRDSQYYATLTLDRDPKLAGRCPCWKAKPGGLAYNESPHRSQGIDYSTCCKYR